MPLDQPMIPPVAEQTFHPLAVGPVADKNPVDSIPPAPTPTKVVPELVTPIPRPRTILQVPEERTHDEERSRKEQITRHHIVPLEAAPQRVTPVPRPRTSLQVPPVGTPGRETSETKQITQHHIDAPEADGVPVSSVPQAPAPIRDIPQVATLVPKSRVIDPNPAILPASKEKSGTSLIEENEDIALAQRSVEAAQTVPPSRTSSQTQTEAIQQVDHGNETLVAQAEGLAQVMADARRRMMIISAELQKELDSPGSDAGLNDTLDHLTSVQTSGESIMNAMIPFRKGLTNQEWSENQKELQVEERSLIPPTVGVAYKNREKSPCWMEGVDIQSKIRIPEWLVRLFFMIMSMILSEGANFAQSIRKTVEEVVDRSDRNHMVSPPTRVDQTSQSRSLRVILNEGEDHPLALPDDAHVESKNTIPKASKN